MSDPMRLGDPDSKSPASLQKLIEAGRSDVPDRERLQSLGARLGFGADSLPAGAGAAKGAVGLAGGTAKIGVALLVVVGAGIGALATGHLAKAPPVVVTEASAVSHAERSPPQPRLADEPSSAPWIDPGPASPGEGTSLPAVVQAPRPSSTSARTSPSANVIASAASTATASKESTGANGLAAGSADPAVDPGTAEAPTSPAEAPSRDTEFSLLEQAQRALHADPRRALELADRDEREFPSGALAQERAVIAIEALVQLGRTDEARAHAQTFFQVFPGSAHGPRVAALLGLDAGFHNP
jgi:hypothetical protein